MTSRVFIGPHGLRAGWRVLIFFALLFAFGLLILVAVSPLLHGGASAHHLQPSSVALMEGPQALAVLLALLVLTRTDRVHLSAYGLPGGAISGKKFVNGLLWGFGSLTLLLLVLRGLHGFYFGVIADPTEAALRNGLWYALGFLLVGFFEETMLRSYPLWALTRGVGFWAAAAITSGIFALLHIHNQGESVSGIIAVFAVGMLFCLFVQRTGDLWFPIGFHAAWDWAETYFYGTPDSGIPATGSLFHSKMAGPAWISGGNTGPEGSYLLFPVLLVIAVAFHLAYRTPSYHPEAVRTASDPVLPAAETSLPLPS
jgi:uncharacterized protein